MAARVADRALHVAGLGDDLESGLRLEQQPETRAYDLVIVREDDADLFVHGAVGLRFIGHSPRTIGAVRGECHRAKSRPSVSS